MIKFAKHSLKFLPTKNYGDLAFLEPFQELGCRCGVFLAKQPLTKSSLIKYFYRMSRGIICGSNFHSGLWGRFDDCCKNISNVATPVGGEYVALVEGREINLNVVPMSEALNASLHFVAQQHTTNIVHLTEENKDALNPLSESFNPPIADAIITTLKNHPICVFVADCIPVVITCNTSSDHQILAVVHSGWRGSLDGINDKVVSMILANGGLIETMRVYIGPSIFAKNYGVRSDLVEKFALKNPFYKRFFAKSICKRLFCWSVPWKKKGASGFSQGDDDKFFFDNRAFCINAYEKLGVKNIVDSNLNTFCDKRFWSHRLLVQQNALHASRICIFATL